MHSARSPRNRRRGAHSARYTPLGVGLRLPDTVAARAHSAMLPMPSERNRAVPPPWERWPEPRALVRVGGAQPHARARARARARTHRMPLTTDHERSTGAPRLVGGCSVTSACAVARHSGATCGAGRTARVAEAAPARAEEEAPARACRRPRKCGRAGCQHAPCVLQPLHGVCAAQEAHSMACDTCWGGRGAEGVEGEGRARAPARRQRARAPPRARAARAAAPATSRAASGGGVGDRLRGVATEGARCAGARAAGTLRGQTSGNDFRQSLPFLIVLMTLPIYTGPLLTTAALQALERAPRRAEKRRAPQGASRRVGARRQPCHDAWFASSINGNEPSNACCAFASISTR